MPYPQKILTSAQMNEIDRRTIENGIPGIILMENAAQRVVELLVDKFSPLATRRIVIVCGRGNNGGDGLAIARQLWYRFRPKSIHVLLTGPSGDLNRDAVANFKMLQASECPNVIQGPIHEVTPEARCADLVVDAVLGTGVNGSATGLPLEAIRLINSQFPFAKVVSVDVPSGLSSDNPDVLGEFVRADYTVTFTAYKLGQMLSPACDLMGELHLVSIGTPAEMIDGDASINLRLITPESLLPLFAPRQKDANKGRFGHVLIVGGSRGKSGAAAMAGMAALRAGAGLVTVASVKSAITAIASHAPELMTEPLPETESGAMAQHCSEIILEIAKKPDLVAIGPGLGTHPETVEAVRQLYRKIPKLMIVDADGLNALAGTDWRGSAEPRYVTPHPGEMARMTGKEIKEIQADRVTAAREFATSTGVNLILKGQRTLVAPPKGDVLVNPTGSPSMAKGGTGDILTGLIAGMIAQFQDEAHAITATAAAVYLHGLAGEIGAREVGDKYVNATDLLRYLPQAIQEMKDRAGE
ncbi:MAG TPA: NAD(P)H-hydrate dehydratase [Bryobacteraceae bacterium]|jgi:NAD(P)H-hydrate epimerase